MKDQQNDSAPPVSPNPEDAPKEGDRLQAILDADENIRAVHERYKAFIQDKELRQAYEDRMKFLHDQANREEMAREEGREQVVREIAAKLKASGMDTHQISELTELTVDEVAGL